MKVLTANTYSCAPVCPHVLEPVAFIGTPLQGESSGVRSARFGVVEVISGVEKSRRVIDIVSGCDLEFSPDHAYLVLAALETKGQFEVSCSGLRQLEQASDDLRILRARARGIRIQELRGRIEENIGDHDYEGEGATIGCPLAGAVVEAKRNGRVFRGKTDAHGGFHIEVPEPGQYVVRPSYPGHSTREPEYTFRVEPSSYAEYFIGMWNNGRITGTVRDANGVAMRGIPVELSLLTVPESAEEEDTDSDTPKDADTDENGVYVFERVPAGDYVVGVDTHGAVAHLPFETRYYPGVRSRREAAPVRVDGPRTRADVDFGLGARLPTRELQVIVVEKNGEPVSRAVVTCRAVRGDTEVELADHVFARTDNRGRTVCEVMIDKRYRVEVLSVEEPEGGKSRDLIHPVGRGWPEIAAGDQTVPVRLAIEPLVLRRPDESEKDDGSN